MVVENSCEDIFTIDGFAEILHSAERATARSSMSLHDRVSQYFLVLREPVYGYLTRFCGSAADAEDLTQEAFLKLYRHLREGKEIGNIRSWMFQVARNLAVSRSRTSMNTIELVTEMYIASADASSEESMLEREREEGLRLAINELTDLQRQCLHLRAEGLRYREIAETLSINIDSVADALERAIRKLRSKVHA